MILPGLPGGPPYISRVAELRDVRAWRIQQLSEPSYDALATHLLFESTADFATEEEVDHGREEGNPRQENRQEGRSEAGQTEVGSA